MGLVESVKENYKKAEAAVVIEIILDMQASQGVIPIPHRGRIANSLIASLWEEDPELYSGSLYPYPHKSVVAARALGRGVQHESNTRTKAALWIALGTILQDLTFNGFIYGLSEFDSMLMEGLWEIQQQAGDELKSIRGDTEVNEGISSKAFQEVPPAASPTVAPLEEQDLGRRNWVNGKTSGVPSNAVICDTSSNKGTVLLILPLLLFLGVLISVATSSFQERGQPWVAAPERATAPPSPAWDFAATEISLGGASTPYDTQTNAIGEAVSAASPSFDCTKAKSTAEQLICSDRALSGLDSEFAALYKNVRDHVVNPTEFRVHAIEEWKHRESCQSKSCLLEWYARRKAQLESQLGSDY